MICLQARADGHEFADGLSRDRAMLSRIVSTTVARFPDHTGP